MLLLVDVFVILVACKKIVCLLKNFWQGAYNVQNRQIWCCYQAVFGVECKLGQQSVLEIVYTIEIKYCMSACGRQFRFVFTQEDDILYRWSMIRESADTTQKGFSTLAKNQQLFSYDTETLFD